VPRERAVLAQREPDEDDEHGRRVAHQRRERLLALPPIRDRGQRERRHQRGDERERASARRLEQAGKSGSLGSTRPESQREVVERVVPARSAIVEIGVVPARWRKSSPICAAPMRDVGRNFGACAAANAPSARSTSCPSLAATLSVSETEGERRPDSHAYATLLARPMRRANARWERLPRSARKSSRERRSASTNAASEPVSAMGPA
jgi:hypothetical protein